jgi:hypothetical protein
MAGCTDVEKAYWQDNFALLEWPAVKEEAEIQLRYQIAGDSVDYTINAVTEQNVLKMQSRVVISAVSHNGNYPDIPAVNLIYDNGVLYCPVKDVINLTKIFEEDIPPELVKAMNKISDSYFYFDFDAYQREALEYDPMMAEIVEYYEQLSKDPINMAKKMISDLINGLPDFTVNMEKNGSTYSLTIDNENAVILLDSLILNVVKNIDGIVKAYPFPDSLKEELLNEIEAEGGAQKLVEEYQDIIAPEIKQAMQSMLDTGQFSFNLDSQYNERDYNINLGLNVEYPELNIFAALVSQGEKISHTLSLPIPAENKRVNVIEFTEEAFATEKVLTVDVTTGEGQVQFHDALPVDVKFDFKVVDGFNYIPAEAVLASLNDILVWNESMKIYYVSTPEGPVILEGEVLKINDKDILYINIWDLMKLGYMIDWFDDFVIIRK